jgi:hypothetical protein
MTDFSQLEKAEKFYKAIRKDVMPLAKKINQELNGEWFPDETSFKYKDGMFLIEYMSTWGRACSCCTPEFRTIRIPIQLLTATEAEIALHTEILRKEEEDGEY